MNGTGKPAGISVSIVTPCYNGAPYLAETLRSALSQTCPPLEIIVIDDGSTDESAAIAERAGAPVRVIRQANQGESVARNRGIAEAKGSHVLFLDADDLLAPEALARLTGALEGRPDSVALMGVCWFTDDPASPQRVQELRQVRFYPEILTANFGPPHCWLTPRHVVQAAGGFCESMRWFEDWDLWWRVGLHADGLIPVGYVGACYRQHAKSQLATTNPADRARGHAALVARMATEIPKHPAVLEAHGEALYWSAWSALTHARWRRVPWSELGDLAAALRLLAARGPSAVSSLRSARLLRWFGVRAGFALRRR